MSTQSNAQSQGSLSIITPSYLQTNKREPLVKIGRSLAGDETI
ncbi:MAG: hypothetical protein RBJ76_16205 [Stenomitos frigidus ULC029]